MSQPTPRICFALLSLAACAGGLRAGEPLADHLARSSWAELECVYRSADVGAIPCGFHAGTAVYPDGARIRGAAANALWQGKHFRCGEMLNQWSGFKAIKADVYAGRSWLDGGPATVLDYRESSFVWRRVRDEIREVAPGVYLGVMFREPRRRAPPGSRPEIQAFFVLTRE